jgi:hypothetical protein
MSTGAEGSANATRATAVTAVTHDQRHSLRSQFASQNRSPQMAAERGEFLNALKFKDISVQVSAREHLPKTPARAGAVTAVTLRRPSQRHSLRHKRST